MGFLKFRIPLKSFFFNLNFFCKLKKGDLTNAWKNIKNCKKCKSIQIAQNCKIVKMQKIAQKIDIFLKIAKNRVHNFPEGQVMIYLIFKYVKVF